MDCNLTVELIDFAAWTACATGPSNGPYAPGCEAFDSDDDDDIDLVDFSAFEITLTAP